MATAVLNTEISEVENKTPDTSSLVTTRLVQANSMSKLILIIN